MKNACESKIRSRDRQEVPLPAEPRAERALTNSNVDDAVTGAKLINKVNSKIKTVIVDEAYDSRAFYAAAEGRSARVVVPPDKTATIGRGVS